MRISPAAHVTGARAVRSAAACTCAVLGACCTYGSQGPGRPAQAGAPPTRSSICATIDASILQDIRYAGPNNFTGRPVPGYAAPECMLLRDVAEALSRVQQALPQRKLSLKVYDCYRPRRAVRAFESLGAGTRGRSLLKRFHPNLDKGQLIDLGYIAAVSGHSRGDTVDLTLVALPARRRAALQAGRGLRLLRRSRRGARSRQQHRHGHQLRLLRSPEPHQGAGLAPGSGAGGRMLVDAMAQHGFHNYHKEWWHFTYMPQRPGRTFDVPVARRRQ